MMNLSLFAQADVQALLDSLRKLSTEDLLLPLLMQLTIIVLAARLFGSLFRKFGQPIVVGEIAAGIILGPSVLGYFWPHGFQMIFHPVLPGLSAEVSGLALDWAFRSLSQLGLVFLLFLIGLEFDFGHLRLNGKSAIAISVVGVALPFVLGLGITPLLHPYMEPHPDSGQTAPFWGQALFLGTAMSITAIPILGRIMIEMNITRTRLGAITISAAAVDDALGWIMLGTVAAVVRGAFDPTKTLLMLAETLGFTLAMIFLVRPFLRRWAQGVLRRGNGELGMTGFALLLGGLFVASILTSRIGIFAIFGAFIMGAILSAEEDFRRAVSGVMRDFVTVFFLPIFFTFTGLRTDIGSLHSGQMWLFCALVIGVAVLGKFGGCGLAAWLSGFSPREATCIGVMMNTRALMELIVINVGYELQVIPRSLYCMLVLMALLTTVITTPTLLLAIRGTELEKFVRESSFADRLKSKSS